MEVLQCYNPHKTGGFCTIRVLQGCYTVPQGATDGQIAAQLRARKQLRARSSAGGDAAFADLSLRTWSCTIGFMMSITGDATCCWERTLEWKRLLLAGWKGLP